eukprot:5949667-Alexandrium_andersonii.AAC.1
MPPKTAPKQEFAPLGAFCTMAVAPLQATDPEPCQFSCRRCPAVPASAWSIPATLRPHRQDQVAHLAASLHGVARHGVPVVEDALREGLPGHASGKEVGR